MAQNRRSSAPVRAIEAVADYFSGVRYALSLSRYPKADDVGLDRIAAISLIAFFGAIGVALAGVGSVKTAAHVTIVSVCLVIGGVSATYIVRRYRRSQR